MPLIFTKENEKGIIKDAVTGTVLVSAEEATVYRAVNQITIGLPNHNFTCDFSDIQTINGSTPTDVGMALDLLYEIFPRTITAAEVGAIPLTEKGQAGGVATLGDDGKIPLEQSRLLDVAYKGTWNASTNVPLLSDAAGTAGNFYVVSVAGTQNLGSGSVTYAIGDAIAYNGTKWEKVPNANLSLSGGTLSGAISIVTGIDGVKNMVG